jgi:hypothetical protein
MPFSASSTRLSMSTAKARMRTSPITPAWPLAAFARSRSTIWSRLVLDLAQRRLVARVEACAMVCGATYSIAATMARFAGLSPWSVVRERM